jgi:small GTP-binding protein
MAGKRILTPEQEKLVAEVRQELINLRAALVRLAAAPEDETAIERSILQLDELFLLVVVGEFNSGKSTLINALVGDRVLEEGVTPTTTRIQVLRHGTAGEKVTEDGFELIEAPADLLMNMQIVDTPGTNAIERKHELITRKFVPRADLVFFVTSADRPFTESERAFLELIRDWGKKIVIVINKVDIFQTAEDAVRV